MVAALGFAGPHIRAQLKFDLLRDADRIVDLDTEISDGAFQLRVTEQQLHGPQVAGLSINLSPASFGASSACRTPNNQARPAQPIDGRSARTGVSRCAAASGNGSGTGIGLGRHPRRPTTRR